MTDMTTRVELNRIYGTPPLPVMPYEYVPIVVGHVDHGSTVVLPKEPVSANTYVKAQQTAALLGVRLTPERREQLKGIATTAEANRLLMEWKAEPITPLVLSEQDKMNLSKIGSPTSSHEYKQLLKDIEMRHVNINKNHTAIENYIKEIQTIETRKQILENLPRYDMVAEVQKILSTGLYKLNSINESHMIFELTNLVCEHVDKELGIDLRVPLGDFLVIVHYDGMRVAVEPCRHNTKVNNYVHPHVNTSYEVCWGNARTMYTKTRTTFDLSGLMTTLYTLLKTYNPESPYAKLREFDMKKYPDKYKDAIKYVACGEVGIDTSDMDDNYKEELEDVDGNTWFIYDGYHKKCSITNITIGDDVPYIKVGDEYQRINANRYSWTHRDDITIGDDE